MVLDGGNDFADLASNLFCGVLAGNPFAALLEVIEIGDRKYPVNSVWLGEPRSLLIGASQVILAAKMGSDDGRQFISRDHRGVEQNRPHLPQHASRDRPRADAGGNRRKTRYAAPNDTEVTRSAAPANPTLNERPVLTI
jgi:hypothetical protein